MKFSVLILPVLASGITALYVPDKLVQAFLKDSSEGNCCNETPCFIGCPVEGVFRVSCLFSGVEKVQSTDIFIRRISFAAEQRKPAGQNQWEL
ncbi:hypothetical protein CPAR01_04383 [Colletotrichum paranaense]|uniref:Uncharacterized protein n=1 Tax=Colletotrichum paranaense TaxID=1914294 RepID=A0ABQ9SW60_9PEZI|nr:uncharacterized protein CPAR01_04383 [Colletotrichum paranaense]KAK1543750.1 hypothetical protein CPAR01_04383 [Colletotrichum paranaense]